jgi:hypothetical protein
MTFGWIFLQWVVMGTGDGWMACYIHNLHSHNNYSLLDVTSCSLIDNYQHFAGTRCFYLQYISTISLGVIL